MPITPHFVMTQHNGAAVNWTLVSHNPGLNPAQSLAHDLASEIMAYICSGSPHLYADWHNKALAATPLPAPSAAALPSYVGPAFGLPAIPHSPPPDHRQGFVAQMLWYFLLRENSPEHMIHIEPVAASATEPGGDGFALHDEPASGLRFRLWEVKKKTGGTRVSGAVGTAYRQLASRACIYLAHYTRKANQQPTPARRQLYSRLVELWQAGHPSAAAGIAVSTSAANLPRRGAPFTAFHKKFPALANPNRLRGVLSAVPDLAVLADSVRTVVWTGL